jgi:hypothetical protein
MPCVMLPLPAVTAPSVRSATFDVRYRQMFPNRRSSMPPGVFASQLYTSILSQYSRLVAATQSLPGKRRVASKPKAGETSFQCGAVRRR